MRKLAWLTAIAAVALFFSAPGPAFAHGSHHHSAQAQTAPAQQIEIAAPAEHAFEIVTFVSAAMPAAQDCPHGHKSSDCDSCCACFAHASVAIAAPDAFDRQMREQSAALPPALRYRVREAVLDLSRPPKSFA